MSIWFWEAMGPEYTRAVAQALARRDDMDQVIVTLDGKDHKIGQGEHTVCGIPVPHGTPREEGQKPCPVCFPKDEETPEPEEVFALVPEPVEAEPEKPAKKATKDAKA